MFRAIRFAAEDGYRDATQAASDVRFLLAHIDAHATSPPCSQCEALRAQLTTARSALARIRNVATAAHAPLAACLDWCANEAVFALDRIAPHADAPSGASDAPVYPCPHCGAMRAALESARPCLKHAAVNGSPDALAALDLLAQALS
jgi:hypothetical protein